MSHLHYFLYIDCVKIPEEIFELLVVFVMIISVKKKYMKTVIFILDQRLPSF